MKTKSRVTLLLALTLALVAAFHGPVFAEQQLSIHIGKTATLVDGGQAVELKIKTICAIEGVEVLEAFVYVTQDGNQSQFAPIPVSCGDDAKSQKSIVRVPALDFLFHEGDANVSAYLLVYDPVTGTDFSTSPTAAIRIR